MRGYGPEQVTGPPNTLQGGDSITAWASATAAGQEEWLLVEFPKPVMPKQLEIFESYNPGAVHKVSVFRLDGREVEAWRGTDPTPVGSGIGISKIPLDTDFKINRVKIFIDSPSVSNWNEIDAVKLVGTNDRSQWAFAVEASSIYGVAGGNSMSFGAKPSYHHSQATGPPDTPRAGDSPTAWVSATTDGQKEWLQLEYAKAVVPKAIAVYETFNPGALYKVSVFDKENKEIEAWSGKDPTPVAEPKGISVIPMKVNFKTKRVRIYLNSPAVAGYNEIDAVGLRGAAGSMQWARRAAASSTYGQTSAMMMLDQMPGATGNRNDLAVQQRLNRLEKEVRELKSSIAELKELLKKQQEQKDDGNK